MHLQQVNAYPATLLNLLRPLLAALRSAVKGASESGIDANVMDDQDIVGIQKMLASHDDLNVQSGKNKIKKANG